LHSYFAFAKNYPVNTDSIHAKLVHSRHIYRTVATFTTPEQQTMFYIQSQGTSLINVPTNPHMPTCIKRRSIEYFRTVCIILLYILQKYFFNTIWQLLQIYKNSSLWDPKKAVPVSSPLMKFAVVTDCLKLRIMSL
jgi:hypothetical protein